MAEIKFKVPKDIRYRQQFFPHGEELVFDTKVKGFVPLPILLRKMMQHLSAPELRVYIYLLLRASRYGICYPSLNDMYRDLGLAGKKNLMPHLQSLVDKWMIQMHDASGKTYFLVHDPRVALKHRYDEGKIGEEELFEIEELLRDLDQEPLVPVAEEPPAAEAAVAQ